MPVCARCHHDVTPGALFCVHCGTPVVPPQPEGAAPDPLIGQTFKAMYFIQQRIGGGGMGDVYKAIHVTLDVPIALKILKRALLADPAIVERFHREARAASRLRHPNVINVTDFGQTDDGTLFMAMEYVSGKSLGRVIAEEFPLSEQRIVHIAAQILSALAEAHANQILHRDLKPENVMLDSRRNEPDLVKVLDFGIAKIQQGDGQSTLTAAGLVCGTPGYMSPEQWGGEPLDARSDLYSVGVILYEMLSGKLPFDAQTPMEMVRKHLTERPLPPSARREDHAVSADLEALVMRALSVDRDQRPGSAEEMRDDLLACVLLPEPARAEEEPRRTAVIPQRVSPARPVRRATPPVGRGTPAPAGGTPPPGRSPTPARPLAGGADRRASAPTELRPRAQAGRTPPVQRRPTPAREVPRGPPRHELDDLDEGDDRDGGAEAVAATPPARRGKLPVVLGAAAAVAAVVAGAVYLGTRDAKQPARTPAADAAYVPDGALAITHLRGPPGSVLADKPFVVSLTLANRGTRDALTASSVSLVGEGLLDWTAVAQPVSVPPGGSVPLAVTVTASPAATATVAFRVVATAGCSGPACGAESQRVTIEATRPALRLAAPSNGRIVCGGEPCPSSAAYNAQLQLMAIPSPHYKFMAWTGDCQGQTAQTCLLLMDGHKSVGASFARPSAPSPTQAPVETVKARKFESQSKIYAFQLPDAESGYGILSIKAEPFGEDVVVNGVSYGSTPRELKVPAGTYAVRVTNSRVGEAATRVVVNAGTRSLWTAVLSPN